jgi:GT2 family glycosyltransferase
MKVLLSIPCLYGAAHTKEAILSVINSGVDLLLIDNGADADVKSVLNWYDVNYANVSVIRNPTNIYVNPAWNQALSYFLEHREYTHLILMNSDLILDKDWLMNIRSWLANNPNDICLPTITEGRSGCNDEQKGTVVNEGTPGVFIMINREHVKIVNPIPKEIVLWFGDNFIFSVLRELGYNTVILNNLCAYHYWSANVSKLPEASVLIEKDKVAWAEVVEPMMQRKIQYFKNNK